MINLFDAIVTRFNSSTGATLRGLATGGMTQGYSPEGTSHPLIELLGNQGGSTDETIGGDAFGARIETALIDFVVHSTNRSPLQAWQVAAEVKRLYDGEILTLSSSQNMVDVKRNNPGIVLQDYDDNSWNVALSYTYMYG